MADDLNVVLGRVAALEEKISKLFTMIDAMKAELGIEDDEEG